MIAWCLLLSLVLPVQDAELAELAEAGRWQDLRERADQRLQLDPQDLDARHWLGRALLEEAWVLLDGDRLARDIGRSVLSRAVEHLRAGAAADPTGTWALRGRYTWLELHQGRTDLSGDPDLPADLERAWAEDGLAEAAYLRGWVERLGGGDGEAWFERAASVPGPRAAHALEWARILGERGDREGAVAAWRAAAEADDLELSSLLATLVSLLPSSFYAEQRLALLDELGRHEQALVAWYRAHAASELGRQDLALAAFDAGTEQRTPAVDRAHAALLAAQDREQEAAALLLPLARERDWVALDQLIGVADGLGLARRFDESLALYDAALAVEPRHDTALRHRAITLWKAGRDAQAAAAWRGVLERSPGRSDLLNDAALAAWGRGDRALARELLERAVALPGARDAQENLALLLMEDAPEEAQRIRALLDAVLAEEPGRDRALSLRYRALRSH